MSEEWNRLAVRLNDTRDDRLKEICGVDEDGNLKRDKSDVIRELIDKEYFQRWHIQLLEKVEELISSQNEEDYLFDLGKFLNRKAGNEEYKFDVSELKGGKNGQ